MESIHLSGNFKDFFTNLKFSSHTGGISSTSQALKHSTLFPTESGKTLWSINKDLELSTTAGDQVTTLNLKKGVVLQF